MARRYLVDPLPSAGRFALPPDVAHHVANVLRARPGSALILHDGKGREAGATLVAAARGRAREVLVDVEPSRPTTAGEPALNLTVVFAPPRGGRGDWVFEHGCEIGVSRFAPVSTDRARVPTGREDKRVDRWRRLVVAAAGQCDRARIPTVDEPRPLADVLTDRELLSGPSFVARPGADRPLVPPPGCEHATVFVGPEGGFTDDELTAIEAAGAQPVGLGPLILRTETAVLAAASLMLLADPDG